MRKEQAIGIIQQHQAALREFHVASLSVFGSVARGEAGTESDIDLLVTFDCPVGLFEFMRVKRYLENALGCRVDLVTPDALRLEMREQILQEAVRVA
ncbi:MAG: nucleotidyltransferase family protein [Phycisphaerae bacterium]|nr:nucleotidyltransferase family protein [Phycisphaerae bacterium]